MNDLARFGLELFFNHIWELDHFTEKFVFDLAYFFPSPNDGPDDLQFTIDAVFTIGFKFWGDLGLETFIDAFVFQGALPINDHVGASIIVGFGLTYDAVFRTRL
jgi:hypothetical protein